MQIQQKSYCSFTLKFKNRDVVINPTSSSVHESIVLYSLTESPYLKYVNNSEDNLVLDAAGEYESSDIFIEGRKVKGDAPVIFTINGENVNVGVISFANKLDSVPVDFFESVDILLLGAGGGMFFTPADAYQLLQKLSPKVCIVFGFEEQAPNDVKPALLSLAEAHKEISGLKEGEKSMKYTEDDLARMDGTEVYFMSI